MLAEEARDLLHGVDVLADDVAGLGGDFLAPTLVLRHVLDYCARALPAADREHADSDESFLPGLAELDDFAAVLDGA